jgi:diaminopimelate epimerase
MIEKFDMTLDFIKMNGAGNDFVVVDNRALDLPLSADRIALLCDRHCGVGADGLLAVEPSQEGADFRMRYYNADGGEAEMCGNGARCFARFARQLIGGSCESLKLETQAGVITADFHGDQVRIGMSKPHGYAAGTPLSVAGSGLDVAFLNTGVPHAVVTVEDLTAVDVRTTGAALRYHEHFAPRGTNVNFVQSDDPGKLRIRTYERGVEDETLACGTGVVACALIHHLATGAESPISVGVKGGDTLSVGFESSDQPGEFDHVTLTGPADFVFSGSITIS